MYRNLGQTIRRAVETVLQVERWVLIGLAFLIALVVFFGVVIRYAPMAGRLLWVEEVARLLLVWLALWATGRAQRTGSHFTFILLRNKLRGKPKAFMELFINLLMLTFVVVLIRESITFCGNLSGILTYNLNWPAMIFPLALVLAGFLLFIYCLADLISSSRRLFREQDK